MLEVAHRFEATWTVESLDSWVARAAAVAERCADLAATSDDTVFPRPEFDLLAEAGLLTAPLPVGLGGAGLGSAPGSTAALLRVLRQIGRGNLAVGRLYEGHVNWLLLVVTHATPAQIRAYADDTCAGHLFGVWNTDDEPGVTITPLGDGRYRLGGGKIFASGAGQVTRPFINGKLPDGSWQMCIVPMERVAAPIDSTWWQAEGMRASTSFRVSVEGVVVDEHALIGGPGVYTSEPAFSGGATRFAAVQLGGAEALFDAARAYLRAGMRIDDPYQRARAGEAAIALTGAALMLDHAALLLDQAAVPTAQAVAYAHMARSAVEHVCTSVLALVDRSVGARGLMRPHPMERIGRDLRLYLRQPAYDAVIAHVGRYLLERPASINGMWE